MYYISLNRPESQLTCSLYYVYETVYKSDKIPLPAQQNGPYQLLSILKAHGHYGMFSLRLSPQNLLIYDITNPKQLSFHAVSYASGNTFNSCIEIIKQTIVKDIFHAKTPFFKLPISAIGS